MRQRGFSLIEVLAGLVILSIVVATSLAVIYQREQRLRDAEATILAYQAMSNEAELIRRTPYGQLDARSGTPFESDLALLEPLRNASTGVVVVPAKPDVKEVILTVKWAAKSTTLSILRSDTGGGNLW